MHLPQFEYESRHVLRFSKISTQLCLWNIMHSVHTLTCELVDPHIKTTISANPTLVSLGEAPLM